MARLDSFLRLVVEQQASDLHFHAGTKPVIRHNNDLVVLPFREVTDTESRRFIMEILSDSQRKELENGADLDFIYQIEGCGRFRANVFRQLHGLSAVFRVIPERLPTLDDLAMPPAVRKLTSLSNGLVLITGPTGSGKTTTLAALINEVNTHYNKHIITIEDPIEFIHKPINSVITQRQVGRHTDSFSSALRSALREAPDVVVVGEMRDIETISLALSAAETGVVVYGTLHTNTAPKAVNRIIDALPEENREQMRGVLSVLLRAVVSQRLLKKASGDGRVAALELLLQNWAVSHMIRENKIHQIEGYLQSANTAKTGMQGMDSCIFDLIRDGLVEFEEAVKNANRPEWISSRFNELKGEE